MKDYYTLLNVRPDATAVQIDAAYRRLMQRHHPNARSSPQALDRMRDLNEAWRVLSDAAQRAAYDHARASGVIYQPPTPVPTLRNVPQASNADFGVRRGTGGTCLVAVAVAFVLVFTVGILVWGLNEQINFGALFNRTIGEYIALLPTGQATPTQVEPQATATPDPRCRDGCETPPPGCVVKGDVETDGSHFFYLPNDEGYSRVNVDIANGDRWFCALSDAQGAGWSRKAPTETPTMPPPPEFFTTPFARRSYTICAENVVLRQGPGDDFPIAQTLAKDARISVTGVNGEWSVIATDKGTYYVRTDQLCAPPTRAAAPTAVPRTSNAPLPTATAAPIASAATTAFKYPAPQLITPTDGERYSCKRPLTLEWSLTSPLAADDYFLVESKLVEHDGWVALAAWTKESSVPLMPVKSDSGCDTTWWPNTGVYEWRVSVVTGNPQTPTHLSPFSESFRINYSQ